MLDKKSDTIGVQDFIWSDRRNLSEIMNEKAGYFINYFGIGGRNPINFNGYQSKQIGIFRDGVQINDTYFGGFDEENISVNEIQKIEEVSNITSFLYGLNITGKSLNIVSKDAFQPTIFSQLRYSQDRYGALFADFSLNIPFSKKFNFIFGINSHFTDGYYQNSSYNVWRGRFKFNYYVSPRLNIKAGFYHNVINRGLNGGLKLNTDDTLKNSNFADVYSLGQYERISFYNADITATGNFFNDNRSLTKLIFFSNNNLRILRNGENGIDTGVFVHNDYHYIQYGIDFSQSIGKQFSKNIEANLTAGSEAYFILDNIFKSYPESNGFNEYPYFHERKYNTLKSRLDVSVYNLSLTGAFKSVIMQSYFHNSFGFESKLLLFKNDDAIFAFKGGVNFTRTPHEDGRNYFEIGIESRYKNIFIDVYQYAKKYINDNNGKLYPENGNYSIKFISKFIDFGINGQFSSDTLYPKIFLKTDLVYHNFFFNNKLDLHLGLSAKYFSKMPVYPYDIISTNYFYNDYYSKNKSKITDKDFFSLDFFIGARIGTANVNLTIANLFDKVNYTTAIYPYDARGGFLNSISRFTIVWDFNR